MTGTEATSARVTEMTVNVISFMTHLAENAETVESFLSVLGVGNWGDGANGGSAQRDALPVMEFGEGQALLSKYLSTSCLSILIPHLVDRLTTCCCAKQMTFFRRYSLRSTLVLVPFEAKAVSPPSTSSTTSPTFVPPSSLQQPVIF